MADDTAAPPAAGRGDAELVAALRSGDEHAFAALVDDLSPSLLRLARTFVPTRAVAEDVVQETWLGVLRGLDGFEGRSSLRTWIFRILTNRAKTRGERERRTVPFSSLARNADDEHGPTVDPERFLPPDHERVPGHWASAPNPFSELPEQRLLASETLDVIAMAVEGLPERQRLVISLRDVEGWSAEEVRNVLELSESNQRVLLHRARAKVRAALEDHLEP